MRRNLISLLLITLLVSCSQQKIKFAEYDGNYRLIILTDMGNEPDDSQTMVHLLMYANEIDIEGLIAVTSRWLKDGPLPWMIEERVEAYREVLPNLTKHADNWPSADELRDKIAAGQMGYGMQAVGDGLGSTGSDLIKKEHFLLKISTYNMSSTAILIQTSFLFKQR